MAYTVADNDGNVSNEGTITLDFAVQSPVADNDSATGLPTNTAAVINPLDGDSDPDGVLDAAIRADLAAGYHPAGVILCTGGTSVGACDRVGDCTRVAKAHGLPVHVDAAWAAVGSKVVAIVRGKPVAMEVCAMPFVPTNYFRG